MRNVETFRGSGRFVTALDDADMEEFSVVFSRITEAWAGEWVERGRRDEGTCCLGVGVSVYRLKPGARKPEKVQVIPWTWSQGDLEAQRTKYLPLGMLAERGILGVYDCGFMD